MIFNLKNVLSKAEIVDLIYPIGSIYISINSTSPATLFGGTWQQIEGVFLLSANDDYPAGTIGGEVEHQLTISEMPEHGHSLATGGLGWYDYGDSSNGVNRWWFNVNGTVGAFGQMNAKRGIIPGWGGGDINPIVNNSGNSQPHNNMPPYLSVYMWKRTN